MSDQPEFEDYTTISQTYDETRKAVGVESILSQYIKPKMKVLDCGSGTGNYSLKIAQVIPTVEVVGFEFNQAMMQKAQEKITALGLNDRVKFIQGSLLEKLPFNDNEFDALNICQVLHHLDDGSDQKFPNAQELMKEFFRVLKPGGVLSINITTHQQADSFWWQSLMPRAKGEYINKHIPEKMLSEYLLASGFTNDIKMIQCKEPLQGAHYFNPAGPLLDYWRNGDSTWSTISSEELNEIRDRLKHMLAEGTAGNYMDLNDKVRREVGQSTFIIANKA